MYSTLNLPTGATKTPYHSEVNDRLYGNVCMNHRPNIRPQHLDTSNYTFTLSLFPSFTLQLAAGPRKSRASPPLVWPSPTLLILQGDLRLVYAYNARDGGNGEGGE